MNERNNKEYNDWQRAFEWHLTSCFTLPLIHFIIIHFLFINFLLIHLSHPSIFLELSIFILLSTSDTVFYYIVNFTTYQTPLMRNILVLTMPYKIFTIFCITFYLNWILSIFFPEIIAFSHNQSSLQTYFPRLVNYLKFPHIIYYHFAIIIFSNILYKYIYYTYVIYKNTN